eukprot:760508-Hanusia_phi.AAC.2
MAAAAPGPAAQETYCRRSPAASLRNKRMLRHRLACPCTTQGVAAGPAHLIFKAAARFCVSYSRRPAGSNLISRPSGSSLLSRA